MKSLKYLLSIAALTVALTLSASATFIVDENPGGEKLFIDVANKDKTDFKGFVGANNSSAPNVDIHTTGPVNTGSGFANIKPIKDGSLTELIFTPEDPNLFADFSFRGQLLTDAGATVNVSVTDNLGNTQTFAFTGLGANNSSAPHVDIHTTGPVDTGSGFANIKPIKDGSLTELIFTPENPNLFADFSFRGQLNDAAEGTVAVTVQDNQGNPAQIFTLTGLGTNSDFARQGIISLDGETIQSVTLTSDFKEVKQIEFSLAGAQVPDSGSTVMLLGVALGAAEVLRRLILKKR